ncbi:CHAP domain-containing protein [Actinomyces succiniciruminis]|uniref:Bacteriophage endolysin n=1 Tax=Actinomyces succiniciruminis TaxID=1522002 RepID=A0A1L7RLX5_9ACTO|nr:CHAP domain-containing protein [Actinomyces succiniciruminis]CED90632.1 Bacteriophage endolysin [Actinomyces succiniciruminis]
MATVSQILAKAASQIGYSRYSDPETGTRYGRWYATLFGPYFGQSGVPYCAMFVSWVQAQCGVTPPGGYFAYVPSGIAAARKEGRLVSKTAAKPGDLACFDWNNDGIADHIGFVERNYGTYYQTIEGNTSASNQSNGGSVQRRTRALSAVIAVIRPDYSSTTSKTPAAATSSGVTRQRTGTDNQLMLVVDGIMGTSTIRRLQQVMGTTIDGRIDTPSPCIRHFQTFLNTAVSAGALRTLTGASQFDVDGVLGSKTWKAFQYWSAHARPAWMRQSGGPADLNGENWGKWVDGIAGPNTVRMLQHCLNSSYKGSGKLLAK